MITLKFILKRMMQIQLHGRFSDRVISDDIFEWIVGFCVAILSTSSIVISRVCALASRIDILTRINNRNLFVFHVCKFTAYK